MKQLNELLTIDGHFQKSVNLHLDLKDPKRLDSYIPTHSSVMILKRYLENIQGKTKENATILIGPYGKGKSHLLLVLLAILGGEGRCLSHVLSKIKKVDAETAEIIRTIRKQKKRFLPVLVSGSGNDLNRSLVYALKEALEREGMEDIVPKSNYSEAVKVLEYWQKEYPKVYEQLRKSLKEQGKTPQQLKQELERMDEASMELFLACYPRLTAGSRFLPMMQLEALQAYQEVNRELKEHYGYTGIVLVFDEFSKYIEGHKKENFAADMKVLQDICELADREKETELRVILVAHKSIHEYEKGIDKSVKNTFRGVEGRLKEVPFIVTARNSYELIADTLMKREPEFSRIFGEYEKQTGFAEIAKGSYRLPCFARLFSEQEQYIQVMEKGCFPLTPVCAYALLHISEKAAQNERTVFTFLTSKEPGSLPRILEQEPEAWVGVDAVYDYFKNLFRENSDQPKIHNEWLKAEYALKRTKDLQEKRIIKAMAIIRMIHRDDELPAQDAAIRLALGMEEGIYKESMERLKQQEIVIFRSSLGIYAFKNNVGVDIEKEIAAEIAKQPAKFPVCRYLEQVSELSYVLPKQHNQKRSMTRYFQYEYMQEEEFFQMRTAAYLFEEQFADGKILALISEEPIDREKVQRKMEELQDDRIVALLPEHPFDKTDSLKRLAAIHSLKEQPKLKEENKVLLRELELYEEDIQFEVNVSLERDFIPGNGECLVCYKEDVPRRFENEMGFNRFLSEICESYYQFSPRVNHELLNIQHVSGNYLRARNKVINALLRGVAEIYQSGTAPECMVYRAAFVRTGIVDARYEKDTGCSRILEEIDSFFMECSGVRGTFLKLYQKLQGKDYGVRKGIMPLFIAQRLMMVEGTPVIYLQKKELEINETVLNNVNDFPENYQLYIEPESGKKEQYLKALEQIWQMEAGLCFTRQKRWIQIMDAMQKWYRSLPQYTRVTGNFEPKERKRIQTFRNLLKRAELNPREFLFERIPMLLEKEDLKEAAKELSHIKKCMDQAFGALQKVTIARVKELYGGKPNESLKGCLLSWDQKQAGTGTERILSSSANELLGYLNHLKTNDEQEILFWLSQIVLDMYMEDWNDETPKLFEKELERIRKEAEPTADSTDKKGQKIIILRDADGQDLTRSYNADLSDSTSGFLKNMIDEAMEDFGDTLETSQKVAVLVEVLQELLQ